MSPDQVRELVLQAFPELTVGPRSDGGWSFFLGARIPPPNSNRIIRVRGSQDGANILRVVQSRIEGKQLPEVIFELEIPQIMSVSAAFAYGLRWSLR